MPSQVKSKQVTQDKAKEATQPKAQAATPLAVTQPQIKPSQAIKLPTGVDIFEQLEGLNKRINTLTQVAIAQLDELRFIRLSRIPFNKDNIRQWETCMNWVAAETAKRKAEQEAAILKQARENQAMLNEGKADGK